MPSRKKINLENLKSNDKLRIKPKKKKKITFLSNSIAVAPKGA
jgi:hypothetical protein